MGTGQSTPPSVDESLEMCWRNKCEIEREQREKKCNVKYQELLRDLKNKLNWGENCVLFTGRKLDFESYRDDYNERTDEAAQCAIERLRGTSKKVHITVEQDDEYYIQWKVCFDVSPNKNN